jgi:hypothetical protein
MVEDKILDIEIPSNETAGKVYSRNQINLATFLGGPLAATYLIANNFKVLGEIDNAKKTWIYGSLGTVLIFGGTFLMPLFSKLPPQIITIAYLFLTSFMVQTFQEKKLSVFLNSGGQKYSWWRTIAVTIIGLLAFLLLLVAIIYFGEDVIPGIE